MLDFRNATSAGQPASTEDNLWYEKQQVDDLGRESVLEGVRFEVEQFPPHVMTLDFLFSNIPLTSVANGFHDEPQSWDRLLMLTAGELFEAHDAVRKGNPPSEKLEGVSHVAEELADTFIRLIDMVQAKGMQGEFFSAVQQKMVYNTTRPVRHGKQF